MCTSVLSRAAGAGWLEVFHDSQCRYTTHHNTPQHITRMYQPAWRAPPAQRARSRSRARTDRDEKQEEQEEQTAQTSTDRHEQVQADVQRRSGEECRQHWSIGAVEHWLSSRLSSCDPVAPAEALHVNNKNSLDRGCVAIATAEHKGKQPELHSNVLHKGGDSRSDPSGSAIAPSVQRATGLCVHSAWLHVQQL